MKKRLNLTCECGEKMSPEDAQYWGECPACRQKLPSEKPSRQIGFGTPDPVSYDIEYQGYQPELPG